MSKQIINLGRLDWKVSGDLRYVDSVTNFCNSMAEIKSQVNFLTTRRLVRGHSINFVNQCRRRLQVTFSFFISFHHYFSIQLSYHYHF